MPNPDLQAPHQIYLVIPPLLPAQPLPNRIYCLYSGLSDASGLLPEVQLQLARSQGLPEGFFLLVYSCDCCKAGSLPSG